MKEPLVRVVKNFLSSRLIDRKPVLLGFSGGVDSSALLSLLIECRSFFSLDLHIAHFDHAWRSESAEEALVLQKQADALGVMFHIKRAVVSGKEGGNLEGRAREERYQFFEEVYQRIGSQALILAHQMDDQAETVLKRVLEGASFLSLGGMQSFSSYQQMLVWRPLLCCSRRSLIEWNEKKGIKPLLDYTNADLQFLRPRMREKLFPELECWFGKNIKKSLAYLGDEINSFKAFVEQKREDLLSTCQKGRLGEFWQAKGSFLEIEDAVRALAKKREVVLSRTQIRIILDSLQEKVLDRRILSKQGELIIDRGNLFWLEQLLPNFIGEVSLKGDASLRCGDWVWEMRFQMEQKESTSLLESLLNGILFYQLEMDEEFVLCGYERLKAREQKQVSSFFSKNKIPAKLRKVFPFIKDRFGFICFNFCDENYLEIKKSKTFLSVELKKISN